MKITKLLTALILLIVLPIGTSAQDGTFDPTFDQGVGCYGIIFKMQVQNDDKIIIAGILSAYNEVPISNFARLNANGTLDTSFDVGSGPNFDVTSTLIQSDGKILIGGKFKTYNGTSTNRLARINPDGSLDTSFNVGSGANKGVYAIDLQADGKVLIGGLFSSYDGNASMGIARLNIDGSLDTSFNIGTGVDDSIFDLAIQPDGKIIIGGYFTSYNGASYFSIARINIDGSLDTTFNAGEIFKFDEIRTLALQPDGKILVGSLIAKFTRLNNDGSVDNSFIPGAINGSIFDILLQKDNKIIVTGFFSSYNGIAISGLLRVNEDGSLDSTFDSGTGLYGSWQRGYDMVLQSDGSLIVGGDFLEYNGHSVGSIARIKNRPLNVTTSEEQAFTYYPNPTSGELHFSLKDETIFEINIYNVKGQRLQRHKVSSTNPSLTFNGLAGLYILELCSSKGNKFYRKLVKR